jgi:Replicative DNA helicase
MIKDDIDVGELSADIISQKIESALIEQHKTADREYLSPDNMLEKCQEVVISRMNEQERERKVINTGFCKLNEVSGGFEAGDLIILSGETGGGKSAFATNLARDIAIVQKQPLLYLNSEMSADQMALRWTSLLGKVKHSDLRNGNLTEELYQEVINDLSILGKSNLHTATIPDLKISSVLSEVRRAKRRYQARVVVVDYIGRVDMENASRDDWQVMTGAARKLKTIAQQEQLVIIMIAQLNAEGRLAQASYMTHEADLWLNLRKPTEKELKEEQLPWWNIVLEIKKARNARMGKIKMKFRGEVMAFYDRQYEDAL